MLDLGGLGSGYLIELRKCSRISESDPERDRPWHPKLSHCPIWAGNIHFCVPRKDTKAENFAKSAFKDENEQCHSHLSALTTKGTVKTMSIKWRPARIDHGQEGTS